MPRHFLHASPLWAPVCTPYGQREAPQHAPAVRQNQIGPPCHRPTCSTNDVPCPFHIHKPSRHFTETMSGHPALYKPETMSLYPLCTAEATSGHHPVQTRKHSPQPISSVQSLSCVRLCDPMNRSMPGLPVHHQLLESTQTRVHQVSDAIQPSHPLSFPSPPAHNPSQHQGLFQ